MSYQQATMQRLLRQQPGKETGSNKQLTFILGEERSKVVTWPVTWSCSKELEPAPRASSLLQPGTTALAQLSTPSHHGEAATSGHKRAGLGEELKQSRLRMPGPALQRGGRRAHTRPGKSVRRFLLSLLQRDD